MNDTTRNVTLVIFTCEGREHLLKHTANTFFSVCNYPFKKIILAIDGEFSTAVAGSVPSALIVQSRARKGYVENIRHAISLVNTPYFFWLEDDWTFQADPDVASVVEEMENHAGWAQVAYSKYEEFPPEFRNSSAGTRLYHNLGFSANPCICRTKHIRDAFHILDQQGPAVVEYEGFEDYLSRYFAEQNIATIIREPIEKPLIIHEGDLESTGREYHSISFSAGKGDHIYLSGFGSDRQIALSSKLAMLPKLAWAAIVLGYSLFRRREAYDYALRIFIAYQKNFRS